MRRRSGTALGLAARSGRGLVALGFGLDGKLAFELIFEGADRLGAHESGDGIVVCDAPGRAEAIRGRARVGGART